MAAFWAGLDAVLRGGFLEKRDHRCQERFRRVAVQAMASLHEGHHARLWHDGFQPEHVIEWDHAA